MAKLYFVNGRSRETTYQLLINKPSGYTHDTVEYRAGEKALLSPTVNAEVWRMFIISSLIRKRALIIVNTEFAGLFLIDHHNN